MRDLILQLSKSSIYSTKPIATLNIGGMAWRPGKKQLTKAVSLDPQDIQAFRELDKLGVKLDLRVVASDPSVNILDKINETAFCE
ncbi:PTS sugar transporter subunit IIB [Klebsiella pneumoniae]|uniref:PTS sugar transporter subunit IIB n=1 Tax=Klebsiella pneumoniae TaxID=573 RepID=UPI003D66364B